MHAQLQRHADTPELPSVTIRIVPLDTNHRLAADSFIILRFDDVVSIERLSNEMYVEGETDTYQLKLAFEHPCGGIPVSAGEPRADRTQTGRPGGQMTTDEVEQ